MKTFKEFLTEAVDLTAKSKSSDYQVIIHDGEAKLYRNKVSADFTKINNIQHDNYASGLIAHLESAKTKAELIKALKSFTHITDWA
jgi:hypothetical protein